MCVCQLLEEDDLLSLLNCYNDQRCSIVPFSAAYVTDEFGMSAFAPLLRDNRTRCARVEFVEPDPNRNAENRDGR